MSLLLAGRLIVLLNRSERLTLELAHRNTELAQQALLVQSSDHAVFASDWDAIVTTWNPAAERLYGYSAAEAIGRSVFDLSAPPGDEDKLLENRHAAEARRDGYGGPPEAPAQGRQPVRRRRDGRSGTR